MRGSNRLFPGNDLAKRLREKSIPLFAVESRRKLMDFDLVGFSLSYELGATNILEMLDLAQINFSGSIGYSGLSEPLLHPKINHRIARSKEVLLNADKSKDVFNRILTNFIGSM